ncbi:MAG TPA: deaminase [Solirubrobacteraceae bacterium]|nr:deaminase [Solirubrobacteraceae bacterium]
MDASPTSSFRQVAADELVFGLVYGAGAETETFHQLLKASLHGYGYQLRTVHLSNYFPSLVEEDHFQREHPEATRTLQDMGDTLRDKTKLNDVVAQLAVFLIAGKRTNADASRSRVVWLVRSLKRWEEVATLRRIYGPRFILFALHVPELQRQKNLMNRWERWANISSKHFDAEALTDLHRDYSDPATRYGQGVRDTFSLADFFVDGRSKASLKAVIPRLVHLIFGEAFVPPFREEQGMYHAFTAGLRSAEMGRQVGAALVNRAGDVVSVGTNDVPTGAGGLYWSPDQPDGRDFARQPPLDSNTVWQRRIARELLVRMGGTGWSNKRRLTALENGAFDVTEERLDDFLRDLDGTRFSSITEFGRSLHAEMDAITSAARKGVPIDKTTLVCTTFPCHNCARHVIASGIERVLYIHPYAKSLARELHDDSIIFEPVVPGPVEGKVVFEQYVGVAPRVYSPYFDFGQAKRKSPRGRAMATDDALKATPRVLQDAGSFAFGGSVLPTGRISELEREAIKEFVRRVSKTPGLRVPTPSETEDEK